MKLNHFCKKYLLTNIIEKEEIRSLMAHRRAFADYFPIGTWGATQTGYLLQRQHHIDTCVKGSDLKSNFYQKEAKKFGYKSLATVNYNDTHNSTKKLKQDYFFFKISYFFSIFHINETFNH